MTTDTNAFTSTTLCTHLESFGFNDDYFGKNIHECIVSVIKTSPFNHYESGLQPVQKKYKSRNQIILVSKFLHAGDMLKFSSVMKSMVPPQLSFLDFFKKPLTTPIVAVLLLYGKIKGLGLNKMSYVEGWVCQHKNPPFSLFPFDEWLTVTSIGQTSLNLYAENGRMWKLGTVALTDPENIDYCSASVKSMMEHPKPIAR